MQTFPEPTWGDTYKIETKCINSLYALKDPYKLTGFFVQWVRALFNRAENIINEKIKGYLWNEDSKLSKITIDPSFKDNPDTTRRRPAIYVRRKGVSQDTPGMKGGMHSLSTDNDGFFRGKDLSSIISGGHSFECIGDTEAEAENIGLEVFFHLLKYTNAIKTTGGLGVFWVATLTETKHAGEGKDYWVCSVNVKWHHTYNWTLDRDAPILKEIGFSPIL